MFCKKCDFENPDSAKTCVNCGLQLAEKSNNKHDGKNDEKLKEVRLQISDIINELVVSKIDRIMMWLSFVFGLTIIVIGILFSLNLVFAVISAIGFIIAGTNAGFPKLLWKIQYHILSLWVLPPDTTPPKMWRKNRRVEYWVFFSLSVLLSGITIYLKLDFSEFYNSSPTPWAAR